MHCAALGMTNASSGNQPPVRPSDHWPWSTLNGNKEYRWQYICMWLWESPLFLCSSPRLHSMVGAGLIFMAILQTCAIDQKVSTTEKNKQLEVHMPSWMR